MRKLFISSPIPISVNQYLSYRVQRAQNGKLFVQAYKSKDSIKYESEFLKIAVKAAKEQQWEIPTKDKYVMVEAIFYFPKHGIDGNNMWKLPLDVLKTAGVYIDDSKVLEQSKRIYIDSENPRMELTIYELPFIGIFGNNWHLESFKKENCFNCTKKSDKCSILKKGLENKLTGDIDLSYNKCNKIKPRR